MWGVRKKFLFNIGYMVMWQTYLCNVMRLRFIGIAILINKMLNMNFDLIISKYKFRVLKPLYMKIHRM